MSGIPAYAQPYFLELVSAYAAKGDEEAQRAMAKIPKKGKRKSLAPGRMTPERDTTIRARVFLRAGAKEADGSDGRCEWDARGFMVLQWHHLFGGGARTAMEREDTTAAICHDCHRGWERNDSTVLRNAKEWAIRHGFKDALARIEKKIAKATEARAARRTA